MVHFEDLKKAMELFPKTTNTQLWVNSRGFPKPMEPANNPPGILGPQIKNSWRGEKKSPSSNLGSTWSQFPNPRALVSSSVIEVTPASSQGACGVKGDGQPCNTGLPRGLPSVVTATRDRLCPMHFIGTASTVLGDRYRYYPCFTGEAKLRHREVRNLPQMTQLPNGKAIQSTFLTTPSSCPIK